MSRSKLEEIFHQIDEARREELRKSYYKYINSLMEEGFKALRDDIAKDLYETKPFPGQIDKK